MASVNWLEIDGKRTVLYQTDGQACYATLFNRGVKAGAKEIILYQKYINYSLEDLEAWVATLNKLGFPCKYAGKGCKEFEISEEYYIFTIDLKRYKSFTHLASTFTLLRYLYEDDFKNRTTVSNFLKVKKALPKISLFKALLMSFALTGYGDGHSCHSDANYLFYTKRSLFKKFEEKDAPITTGVSHLHAFWRGKTTFIKNNNDIKSLYKKMNNNQRLVYVVGMGGNNYANWLPDFRIINKLADADLVLFTGGEDVDPSLYGEPMGKRTCSNLHRDLAEKKLYETATKLGIKKLGICRGSQFLCVMAGGKLVQHQENPKSTHKISLYTGREINITSTHHQAAYPYKLAPYDYQVLGWTNGISKYHLDGNEMELYPKKECEIVWYNTADSLGIQGHPEFEEYQRDPANAESLKELKNLVNSFMLNQL